MKKLIVVLLTLSILCGFAACGKTPSKPADSDAVSTPTDDTATPVSDTTEENTTEAAPKPAFEGTQINIGDTKEAADYKFTLDKAYFTEKLSEKHGSLTRSFGSDGKYYFVLQLAYTNLSTEAFDGSYPSNVTDEKLLYQDKYSYEGDCRTLSNDIVSLDTANVYVYYEIPKSMESDTGSVTAGFTLYGDSYYYVLREGTASEDTENASDQDSAPATSADPQLHVGDERTNGSESKMVLDKIYFTNKISEKHGSVTRSFGSEGKYYLVLQFSMTNLSSSEFSDFYSDRITDSKLTYNEKYTYDGSYTILTGDIVPLDTANLYLYFEVPKQISEDTLPLVADFTVDGCTYTVDCRAN